MVQTCQVFKTWQVSVIGRRKRWYSLLYRGMEIPPDLQEKNLMQKINKSPELDVIPGICFFTRHLSSTCLRTCRDFRSF